MNENENINAIENTNENVHDENNASVDDTGKVETVVGNEHSPAKDSEEVNAYKSIINQQQEQINALLDQTNRLNEQIVNLVQSGGQFAGDNQSAPVKPSAPSLEDDIFTFDDIAHEIGKH